MSAKKIVMLSMFASISYTIMWLGISIIPIAPFLKYEPSDVPLMMATLMFGPHAGLLALITKELLYFLIHGGNILGIIMHFFAAATFILTMYFFVKRTNLIVSGIIATIAMAIVMIPLNMIIVPLQFGTPFENVWALMLPVYIPFNLIKGALNTVILVFVWSMVKDFIKVPKQETQI